MLHTLQWLYTYVSSYVPNVSSVLDICCKYFHLDVAKVDMDIVYIYMHILQAYFSSGFRCFKHLLQVFHLDVVYVCNGFQVFLRCFCKCF
jgi:hypothetical protein